MRPHNFLRYGFSAAAGLAILAACSANGSAPSPSVNTVAPMSVGGNHTMTRRPIAHSWMRKPPKGTSGTIWATDVEYASVDIVAYPSGALIGQVSGFEYPYGDCSDKQGNVYVADFDLEEGFEIQAGTTKVINSWPTGGEAVGCSVSNSGDVSFSNYTPSEVIVFPGGGPSGRAYPGPGQWPAGYDPHGNLFVICTGASPCSTPQLAELPAGSTSWIYLNVNGSTLNYLYGAQWMDKYLGVGGVNGTGLTGIALLKIAGSTATVVKTITLGSTGCSTYMNGSISWGSVAKKPDGVVTKKIKGIVAANLWCFPSPINVYKAKGGNPLDSIYALTYQYDYGVTFTAP